MLWQSSDILSHTPTPNQCLTHFLSTFFQAIQSSLQLPNMCPHQLSPPWGHASSNHKGLGRALHTFFLFGGFPVLGTQLPGKWWKVPLLGRRLKVVGCLPKVTWFHFIQRPWVSLSCWLRPDHAFLLHRSSSAIIELLLSFAPRYSRTCQTQPEIILSPKLALLPVTVTAHHPHDRCPTCMGVQVFLPQRHLWPRAQQCITSRCCHHFPLLAWETESGSVGLTWWTVPSVHLPRFLFRC